MLTQPQPSPLPHPTMHKPAHPTTSPTCSCPAHTVHPPCPSGTLAACLTHLHCHPAAPCQWCVWPCRHAAPPHAAPCRQQKNACMGVTSAQAIMRRCCDVTVLPTTQHA